MRGKRNLLRYTLSLAALSLAALPLPSQVFASATDGTIDATSRYAWSENAGWIDFGSTEGNVHVTDTALSGYAWGEDAGWISLNCSNTESCATVDFKVTNDGEGTLGGHAWSENVGWIQFAPANGGVTIASGGEFEGYAWNDTTGWIVFKCGATASCESVDYRIITDWRPASARATSSSSSAQAEAGGSAGGHRGSPAQMAARIAQASTTILARFEGKRQKSQEVVKQENKAADEELAASEREDRIAKRIAEHETAVALAQKGKEELQKKYDLHREERYAKALALQEQQLAEAKSALLAEQEELKAEQAANAQRRQERLTERSRLTQEQELALKEEEQHEEQAANEREARIAERIAEHETALAQNKQEQEELQKKYAQHREERFARALEEEENRAAQAQAALALAQQELKAEQAANAQRKDERLAERVAMDQKALKAAAPLSLSSKLEVIAARRDLLFATIDEQPVIYSDVPLSAWYAPYVSYVIEEKIATGYADDAGKLKGEFGVENPITYAEVLKMAMQASDQAFDLRGLPPARNKSAQGLWSAPYVSKAESLQLSVFAPSLDVNKPATRGAVIQTLLEVLGITIGNTPTSYDDVPKNHSYSPAIAAATFFGLVQGDLDADGKPLNRFRPDDPINRAEVAKIIALAKELTK
ncbi:MAG: S-layer homology domain-containing protein [Candidatus Peribacteraceae bacterium]|nr:S-layer homology domain-containing protein [Candidatus Peribacteraceae bacterium]MDD5742838.1 S-layer homology domain-containing protein [Candidatus Peribacteraceae bacterium]